MKTRLALSLLTVLASTLPAQGRPAILRGGIGASFPLGKTADLWHRGYEGALALSLPSDGRIALRLEGAYAHFPIDLQKLRARYSFAPSERLTVSGGARDVATIMALLETYLTGAGDCSSAGPLPPRVYFLIGAGYAGLFSRSYTVEAATATYSSPRSHIDALAIGAGLGGEWPLSPRWGFFVETRSTSWWDLKNKFDPKDQWISARGGLALAL